jgi:hypothetical protein
VAGAVDDLGGHRVEPLQAGHGGLRVDEVVGGTPENMYRNVQGAGSRPRIVSVLRTSVLRTFRVLGASAGVECPSCGRSEDAHFGRGAT